MRVSVVGEISGTLLGRDLARSHFIEIFDFMNEFCKTIDLQTIAKLNGMITMHDGAANTMRVVLGEILKRGGANE